MSCPDLFIEDQHFVDKNTIYSVDREAHDDYYRVCTLELVTNGCFLLSFLIA